MPSDNRLNPIALGSMAFGSILVYSGITGKSVLSSLYAVTSGKSPSTVSQSAQISGASVAATSGPVSLPSGGSVSQGDIAAAKAYAFSLFPSFGWGTDQQAPLDALWTQESGWRWNATNPSSGAYGIPQSLPDSKMASAGADWKTNPATQIKWGLTYIHQVYGNPAGAEQHEKAHSWY